MVDDTRRPFWRSPTVGRYAAGAAILTAFFATWTSFAMGGRLSDSIFAGALTLVFVGIVGAAAIGAVGLALGAAFDRQAERRRAAAKAFADARPDPRNRTGPSITIWPEDEAGRLVAFVEYADGKVDDLTIDDQTATFASITELLYRLAARQAQVIASTSNEGDDVSLGLIVYPAGGRTVGPALAFPPASSRLRRNQIAAREAAFRASMGGGPPPATD